MPSKNAEGWFVPPLLRLQHVQRAGNDEPGAADDLRCPVYAVEEALGHFVIDSRKSCESRDPKDGGAAELGERGYES